MMRARLIALGLTLLAFVVVHLVLDFPLQGDTTAREKNPRSTSELQRHVPWWYWMAAHASMHALGVFIVATYLGDSEWHPWRFAMNELVGHFWIDWLKCRSGPKGAFNIHLDQGLHLGMKLAYAATIVGFIS